MFQYKFEAIQKVLVGIKKVSWVNQKRPYFHQPHVKIKIISIVNIFNLVIGLAPHHYLCAQVYSQICKCKDVALKLLVAAVKLV